MGFGISAFSDLFRFFFGARLLSIILNYKVMSKCMVHTKYHTNFNLGLLLLESIV